MEKWFKLKENNTSFKQELLAGLTSFFAAVYIIPVNASILSDGGISVEAGIIATVLIGVIGALLMGFGANAPLILLPGMGINALFVYTVILSMGLTYNQALACVFLAGILFMIIAFTKLSDILITAIPHSLKESITVGIGLFITFIGLQKSAIIVSNPDTFLALGDFSNPIVIVSLINIIITVFLFVKKVNGNFLISIILGSIVAILFGTVDFSGVTFSNISFNGYSDIFFKMDFSAINSISFWSATFSFLLVLVFENIGLVHGQLTSTLSREDAIKPSLKATSISCALCGLVGTSPTVSTVECAAGIESGGKTGLTSLIVGILSLVSLLFIPFIKIIPSSAIAPILIMIGSLMMSNINKINFSNVEDAFPAFLTIVMIPFTYSIVDGIAFGFISYTLVQIFLKKYKNLSITMYIVSAMFLLNFILHAYGL